MNLFLFDERPSLLHRLNPLAKLVVVVLLMVVLTAVVDPITPLVFAFLVAITVVTFGQVPAWQLASALKPFLVIAFGLFWTTALFYAPGPNEPNVPIARLGPIVLGQAGATYGLSLTFRILAIFLVSLLYVFTTDPTALVQALIQQWHLDDRFGYGILAAYRFVPLFETQLRTIQAAHRVRGVRDSGGPVAQYRRFVGYLIPLLAGGVRQAERVAIAMDSRGFGGADGRTYYRRMRFTRTDGAFLLSVLVTTIFVLAIRSIVGRIGLL